MEFGYNLKIKFINMKEMIKGLSLYLSYIAFSCSFLILISSLLPPSEYKNYFNKLYSDSADIAYLI